MFLHLICPHRFFVGVARSMFEAAAPGQHVYVIYGWAQPGEVVPEDTVHWTSPSQLRTFIEEHPTLDGVILHGIAFGVLPPLMRQIPADISIAWYVWGYEAQDFWKPLRSQRFFPRTAQLLRELEGKRPRPTLRARALRLRSRIVGRRSELRKAADRIDHCVVQIQEEFELYRASGLLTRTQFQWGSYGSLEDYVDMSQASAAGEDFQLGHCASAWANHLDALPLFLGPDRDDRRVVVPLTYGDALYRDAIIAAARDELGERLTALVDYLPQHEYQRILESCGHVVMNFRRQEAVGNIYAALWRGAHVYLNDTTVYRWLTRLGLDVDLIERDLAPSERSLPLPVSDSRLAGRRDTLREYLDRGKVLSATSSLLERIAETTRTGRAGR